MFSISWDYSKDEVTIAYDPKRTNPESLAKTISDLGYTIEEVEPPEPPPEGVSNRIKATLPKDAPKFFADAFRAARKDKRPIVIDFWATWCGPCIQLKEETLADAAVSKALKGIEVIYVDLDENPALAAIYKVKSVPDVFFIDADGYIVDRLQTFEKAEPFLVRLRKLSEAKPPKDQQPPR